MKTTYFLFTLTTLVIAHTVLAQRKENRKEVPLAVTAFDKGTLSFTNRMNLNYTNFSSLVSGDPKNFDFRVDPSYFFMDGFAVGIDARTGSNSSKNTKSSFSSWQLDITATYGRQINDRIGAYLKLFAGPGGSHSEFDISTLGNNPQKLKATYFDVKGMIGAPIALDGNSAAFFTPFISYDSYKTNTVSNDFKDKAFTFGFKLESYIRKGQWAKGSQQDDFSKAAYMQGAHFLEFTTAGSLNADTRQQKQNGGTTLFAKQKNTTTSFGLGYNYYIIDNLAVGLNLSLNKFKTGYVGTTSSTTSTFMVTPVVTAQAPLDGAGRNLFLQASYGFGSYKEPKKNLSDLTLKAGYNLFLAKYLTLTPKIGYENIKGKVPSGVSGIPYTNKGIVAEIGVRSWLNFWNWKK